VPPIRHRAVAFFIALVLPLSIQAAEPSTPEIAETPLRQSVHDTAQIVWDGAQSLAIYALGMIGVDYKFGGSSPDAGLDCSGLVRYVFQQVTGVTLPRTAREMSKLGDKVAADELRPGDLVFFNTRRLPFSHVGIYLGDDHFIHAPRRGAEVEISKLGEAYWRKHFTGARRLYGVIPQLAPLTAAAALTASATAETLPAATPAAAPIGDAPAPQRGAE
jgi:hypothetical protein